MKNFRNLLHLALLLIGFSSFHIHALYRRGHTDIARELAQILKEQKRENYYFSLLPIEVQQKIERYDRGRPTLNKLQNDIEKAFHPDNRANLQFVAWFYILFGAEGPFFRRAFTGGNLNAAKIYLSSGCNRERILNSNPLYEAVKHGHTPVVAFLLDAACTMPVKYDFPIQVAAEFERVDCVRFLLDRGSDPDGINIKSCWPFHSGKTALIHAAEKGNLQLAKLLLEQGAVINKTTSFGLTALHYAVSGNHLEVVQLLIARGINVNQLDSCKRDPALRYAVQERNVACVKMLLDAGADPNPRVYNGHCESDLYSSFYILCPRGHIGKFFEIKSLLEAKIKEQME